MESISVVYGMHRKAYFKSVIEPLLWRCQCSSEAKERIQSDFIVKFPSRSQSVSFSCALASGSGPKMGHMSMFNRSPYGHIPQPRGPTARELNVSFGSQAERL